MNTTIEFLEKYLPEHILTNKKESIESFSNPEEEVERYLIELWEKFNKDNLEFPLQITIRNSRNKKSNIHEKMVLIKINSTSSNEEPFVSSVIYLNINNVVKYFTLDEIDNKLLPITFIKNNEKFLLKEIEDNKEIKNWGKLLNPKNLSSVINSISTVVSQ